VVSPGSRSTNRLQVMCRSRLAAEDSCRYLLPDALFFSYCCTLTQHLSYEKSSLKAGTHVLTLHIFEWNLYAVSDLEISHNFEDVATQHDMLLRRVVLCMQQRHTFRGMLCQQSMWLYWMSSRQLEACKLSYITIWQHDGSTM
jgi:hypothetical protein